MDNYFPENVDFNNYIWVQNIFSVNVSEVGENISWFLEQLINHQESQVRKENFKNIPYSKFWPQLKDKFILTRETKKAFLHLFQRHLYVSKGFQVCCN